MDLGSDSDDGLSSGPVGKDLIMIIYVHGQVRLGLPISHTIPMADPYDYYSLSQVQRHRRDFRRVS